MTQKLINAYGTIFNPAIAHENYDRHGNYFPASVREYVKAHPHTELPTEFYIRTSGPYSPASSTINENWRFAMQELQPENKSVLTVAPSGGQAIAFAVSGAKDIDVFAGSFFSTLLTRIKLSAIPVLDCTQYTDFITGIANAKSVQDIPLYDTIAPKCSRDVIAATKQMRGCKIFHNGVNIRQEYMPTESEYNIAQQNIANKSVRIIWSDLQDLHRHLDKEKKYGIIYLSNIFEEFHQCKQITDILKTLKPFLNVDGQIMLYSSSVLSDTAQKVKRAAQKCSWGTIKSHEIQNAAMLILTRNR